MKTFLGTVVGVLLFCIFSLCLWKFLYTAPRAWKRRNKEGFWAAMSAVTKEDRERFLTKQQAKARRIPAQDDDQEPIAIYDEPGQGAPRNQALEDWEASLVRLWHGSAEIEFTYDSRSGKMRRKITLEDVFRNDRFSIYLRGICHTRNETRTFSRDYITTKILAKGKRYEVEDFLIDVLGVTEKQLGW